LDSAWTPGRIRSFITAVLRSGSRRWPPRYQTLNNAYVGQRLNTKTNREGKHYLCALCQGEFPAKEVQIDHISPVVDPEKGFISWDVFIERLYCDADNMQTVCKPCHKIKSKKESSGRKKSIKE